MEIHTGSIDFPTHKGSGPQTGYRRVGPFPSPVAQAHVVLTGYHADFTGSDHNLGQLTVQLGTPKIANSAPDGPEVVVPAVFGLRDHSGNWDDAYEGQVSFCLMIEYERSSPSHPIRDLDL